jgi:hypothetical protein
VEETVMVANRPGVDVTVNLSMNIDKCTAEGCLKIVEMYVNANNARVIADREPNGDVRYHYEFA